MKKALTLTMVFLSFVFIGKATNIPYLIIKDSLGVIYPCNSNFCPGQSIILSSDNPSMNSSITCQFQYQFKDNNGTIVQTIPWNNVSNQNTFKIPLGWNANFCVQLILLPNQSSTICTTNLDTSYSCCFTVGNKPSYANINLSNHSFCSNDPLAALNFQSFVNYGDTCLYTLDGVGLIIWAGMGRLNLVQH